MPTENTSKPHKPCAPGALVTRRQGREWALQMLVQFDLNPPTALDEAIGAFWDYLTQLETDTLAEHPETKRVFTSTNPDRQAALAEVRAFAEERVRGVLAERDALDTQIEGFLRNWALYRLGTVERAALRMCAWELRHCPDIPAPILVNEAIDLAKFFSETRSGKFVNGVLDKLARSIRAPKAETWTV